MARVKIYSKQLNIPMTAQDYRALRAARRPDEQFTHTARRLLREALAAGEVRKVPENSSKTATAIGA